MMRVFLLSTIVGLWILLLSASTDAWSGDRSPHHRRRPPSAEETTKALVVSATEPTPRRSLLQQLLAMGCTSSSAVFVTTTVHPDAAAAGEIGARINRAVTQSDLGISVRRSVVKGAQVMDQLDGQWEQFSDRFQLGSARQNQARPQPKIIPPPQPLNAVAAQQLLQTADRCFLDTFKATGGTTSAASVLQAEIDRVQTVVAPSFRRSGVELDSIEEPLTAPVWNAQSYIHFKAYSNLLLAAPDVNFRTFKSRFETQLGTAVVNQLSSSVSPPASSSLSEQLSWAQRRVEDLGTALVKNGLVAQVDIGDLSDDQIADWTQDLSELHWTIALDGDTSLAAQLLLQEQGLRLYPCWGKWAVQQVLQQAFGKQQVLEVTDYFMDTDYNSDPDKFEVKEILLDITLESA